LAANLRCSASRELFFDPGDILPGSCVNGYLGPFLNEGGYTQFITRFQGDRFTVTGNGVPLGPGICSCDSQVLL
jgi:hypothetical protein